MINNNPGENVLFVSFHSGVINSNEKYGIFICKKDSFYGP